MTREELVSDELWEIVESLLPEEPSKPRRGRPRLSDRTTLTGLIYVLKSGIPCRMLPQALGCGSGVTCWRRLRDWQEAGVWRHLHRVLLDYLGKASLLDWSRAALDSASIPAKRGGEKTGPGPVDRGRAGSKRHVVTDVGGVPLAVVLTGANVHYSKVLEELVDSVAPVKGRRGRPRKMSDKLHADKGYDYPAAAGFFASGA